MAVAVAACVMIVGSATVAYAADLGGIQRTLQLWIHGDQTEVTIEFDGDGNYNMQYADSEGKALLMQPDEVRRSGGLFCCCCLRKRIHTAAHSSWHERLRAPVSA